MIRIGKSGHKGKYNNAVSGKFIPIHREKYQGQYDPIFKSNLERKMMMFLDRSPNVISWSYEKFSIKYIDKSSKPERLRNYYIDFVAVVKTKNGPQKVWIEVKQSSETRKPVNESDIRSMKIWLKNQSKWQQAEKTARQNGAVFKIITESQLN